MGSIIDSIRKSFAPVRREGFVFVAIPLFIALFVGWYWPPVFWIGAIVVLASAVNVVRALAIPRDRLFAEWSQLAQVRKVVIPMAIYVAAVPWLGIYVSSALLIAGFMRWLGRYGWLVTVIVSVALPVLIYVTFENWFLVPLPKGPLEDWLGL